MSAAEDDTELRDLLLQNLEKSGIMNKLKAEVRAAVFLAMEEQDQLEKRTPAINQSLKRCLNTEDGQLVVSLILDFLQVFHLDFTLSVFRPEINSVGAPSGFFVPGNGLDGRDAVCRQLRLPASESSSNAPLLLQLVRRIRQEADQEVLRSEVGSEERSGSAGPSQGPGCPEQRQQQQQLDLPEDPQDSFFDDPLPKAQKTYGWRAETSQSRTSPVPSLSERQRPAGRGDASDDQDSRGTSSHDPKSPTHRSSSHLGDFEYGDDFNSHRSILSRSDGSIGEEIEEVSIEGPELSDKCEGSTEDVSVSQLSAAHGAAYMEDVS